MTESSEVPLELSVNVYTPALIAPLPETNELVWFSESSGRGHLYLVDLVTGERRNAITSGDWQVREVLRVDPRERTVRFVAGGLDPTDPYLRRPCVASLDGGEHRVLSDDSGDHQVWRPSEFSLMAKQVFAGIEPFRVSGFSPDGAYFVETIGSATSLPTSSLRRADGTLVCVLEQAQAVALPSWFRWPKPFSVRAADGITDVYGLLFSPEVIDAGRSYPLIDLIYAGPQVQTVPKAVFADDVHTATFFEAARFAELGGFCMVLDGRGTAMRERDFRHASLGAIHTASNLADHEAAIRQLAETHPIDLDSVGMTGFSGGGYGTALAAFTRGDFFRVTVAGAGNYDQAVFWHGWGERYHGPYDPELYAQQAAATYAAGLQDRLMLLHGLLDSGCHPSGLFHVVQALNDANKDYDLVILPAIAHGSNGYAERRRLDHFVRHLFHAEPPTDVVLEGPHELTMKKFSLLQFSSK